jgi:hypothetical protein
MPTFLLQFVSDPNAWNATVAKATVVIAIATILYLMATVLLWLTTRRSVTMTNDMFKASHRPYVGSMGVQRQDREEPRIIDFIAAYSNFGSIPAFEYRCNVTLIADRIVLPNVIKEEEEVIVLFPSQQRSVILTVHEPDEVQAIENASTVSLIFECTYQGVAKTEYRTTQKYISHKELGTFAAVRGNAT